jgi:hypothetical protein
LADVPDTREYMPVDIEGLNAIGISQTNAPTYMDDDDDDADEGSDAEDVLIRSTDAIVVLAKTEEVSSCRLRFDYHIRIPCNDLF